jgi:hypothetical protein
MQIITNSNQRLKSNEIKQWGISREGLGLGILTKSRTKLDTNKIHPIFHVSFLKKVIRNMCQTQTSLPELDEEGSIWL